MLHMKEVLLIGLFYESTPGLLQKGKKAHEG